MNHACLSIAQNQLRLMELKLGSYQYSLMMNLLERQAYEASLGDGSSSPINIGKTFSFHVKLIETRTEAIFDMVYLGEAKDGRPRFFLTRFRWEAFKVQPPLEVDATISNSSPKSPASKDYKEIKNILFVISAVVAAVATIMANLSEIGYSLKNFLEIASTIAGIAIGWFGKSD